MSSSDEPFRQVNLDMVELTVRMIEAMNESPRPDPDAYESLMAMPEPYRSAYMRGAQAAVQFLAESFAMSGADISLHFPDEGKPN